MKQTQSILQVSQYLSPGGLERMIWQLSLELKKTGHPTEVFVYDHEGGQDLISDFVTSGIPVLSSRKEKGFSWSTVQRLRKLIQSHQYQVIHSHDLGALIYACLAKLFSGARLKHIHTQHSFIHFNKKKKSYPIYERIFCRLADQVVVVSPNQVADYQQLGIQCLCIQNGIAFPPENPFPENAIAAKEASLISRQITKSEFYFGSAPAPEKKWILLPGRIQASKAQHMIFKLLKSLTSDQLSKLHFILIGSIQNQTDYQKLLEEFQKSSFQNSVSYLGFVSHPLEIFSLADGVISLSQFEGLPLVPIESIGLGLPTLLSDILPHQYFKDFATLFDPHSQDDLFKNWIHQQILPQNFRDAAWKKSQNFRFEHSIQKMTQQYLKLYGL